MKTSATENKLLSSLMKGGTIGESDAENILADLRDLDRASWSANIPKAIRDHWHELPTEAQLVAFVLASEIGDLKSDALDRDLS